MHAAARFMSESIRSLSDLLFGDRGKNNFRVRLSSVPQWCARLRRKPERDYFHIPKRPRSGYLPETGNPDAIRSPRALGFRSDPSPQNREKARDYRVRSRPLQHRFRWAGAPLRRCKY